MSWEKEEKQQLPGNLMCQAKCWLIYSLKLNGCSTCPFNNMIYFQLNSRKLYLLIVFVGVVSRICHVSSCYILTCHHLSILFLKTLCVLLIILKMRSAWWVDLQVLTRIKTVMEEILNVVKKEIKINMDWNSTVQ